MAGRPGRSGGHNKISLERHIARGTYNPTRHGPKPPLLVAAGLPRVEAVPAGVTAGLSGRGLAFVTAAFEQYGPWSPGSLVLLREAGQLIEQLEALRGQRGERPAQRLLLATLAALRLEE